MDNQTGNTGTVTGRERLALEQAASGCVSGTLAEWPVLLAAFASVGVNVAPEVRCGPCVRLLARAALEALEGWTP